MKEVIEAQGLSVYLAIVAVLVMFLWLLIGGIKKYTDVYLFTNYQDVGVWTNQLQEHLVWTTVAGLGVFWYTSSVQKMFICMFIGFVLPRTGTRILGALGRLGR